MANDLLKIKKLQKALNAKGQKILFATSPFWSEQAQREIPVYIINQAVFDEESKRFKKVELFRSTSQIQIVLYLRDMWYELNGQEPPNDNEYWNEIKAKTASVV